MKLYKSIFAVALLFVGLNIGNAHAQSCSASTLMSNLLWQYNGYNNNPNLKPVPLTFQAAGIQVNDGLAWYAAGTLTYDSASALFSGTGELSFSDKNKEPITVSFDVNTGNLNFSDSPGSWWTAVPTTCQTTLSPTAFGASLVANLAGDRTHTPQMLTFTFRFY